MKTGNITKIVIVSIIALALLLLGIKYLSGINNYNKKVEIYVDSELYKTIDINKDSETVITDENGDFLNKIVVKNKEIFMQSASCPDQICVKTGKITDSSKMIVCLPHKVVVKIVSDLSTAGVSR